MQNSEPMKNVQTISYTNYFENIKNEYWGAVSHLWFSGVVRSPFSHKPTKMEDPWAPRIPKWQKLEYCNTMKIMLYNFVIIFLKKRFKKNLLKNIFETFLAYHDPIWKENQSLRQLFRFVSNLTCRIHSLPHNSLLSHIVQWNLCKI